MKISILVSDLSSHCLVRTYPIAKVLERHYKVEVIGPIFGNGIFKPYKNELDYKAIPLNQKTSKISKIKKGILGIKDIFNAADGDIIYAFKPRVTSFGIGLLVKYLKGRPLILDIEDWEAEPYYKSSVAKKIYLLGKLYSPDNHLYNRLMEPLTKLADGINVVSNFLQNRYGGIKLPHGADCYYFDPAKYNRETLRRKWGFDYSKKLILFTGTPMPHKGLEEVLQALKLINSDSIQLITVGKQTDHLEKLKKLGGDLLISIEPQPHSSMPEILKLADLVILPQRNTAIAEAQVPGKVFEAMAMAKPIIATNVSDLPEILDGCGWIIEPEKPKELAKTIQYVLDNPKEAEKIGQKARQKCIEKYSWDAMEEILIKIFGKYE